MLSHVKVGTDLDCTIREVAKTRVKVTGFTGNFAFYAKRRDGAPRKLLNVSRLAALGWLAKISLEEGLRDTYTWFLRQQCVCR